MVFKIFLNENSQVLIQQNNTKQNKLKETKIHNNNTRINPYIDEKKQLK